MRGGLLWSVSFFPNFLVMDSNPRNRDSIQRILHHPFLISSWPKSILARYLTLMFSKKHITTTSAWFWSTIYCRIATAFVHFLPTAASTLTTNLIASPLHSGRWSKSTDYITYPHLLQVRHFHVKNYCIVGNGSTFAVISNRNLVISEEDSTTMLVKSTFVTSSWCVQIAWSDFVHHTDELGIELSLYVFSQNR